MQIRPQEERTYKHPDRKNAILSRTELSLLSKDARISQLLYLKLTLIPLADGGVFLDSTRAE
jgi:hypothetical protein